MVTNTHTQRYICAHDGLGKLCFRGSGVLLFCRQFMVLFPKQDDDSARDKTFRPSQAIALKQWSAGNHLTTDPFVFRKL